jgi:hypothetical protein
VAFTALYGGNLDSLASVLEMCQERAGWTEVSVAEELLLLIDRAGGKINYDDIQEKKNRLNEYFHATESGVKGNLASIPLSLLLHDLKDKAGWIKHWINQNEWIEEDGFQWYNGYYDNDGNRVEGKSPDGTVRMTLTGQVYPIMSHVAEKDRISQVVKSVNQWLFDKELGGFRLNTNFGSTPFKLGRAFSFVYGEKENGAVFSHMAAMYANALYQREFAAEGHRVLRSLYQMAKNGERSRIYPGIPEYFNREGRGRYMYLTGSASWFLLTHLTQVFGVRGEGGDLALNPKLDPSQFDKKKEACVTLSFAGSRLKIVFQNPDALPYDQRRIATIRSREADIPFTRRSANDVLIQREVLSAAKNWEIKVRLQNLRGS